jgi:hypothetical protein
MGSFVMILRPPRSTSGRSLVPYDSLFFGRLWRSDRDIACRRRSLADQGGTSVHHGSPRIDTKFGEDPAQVGGDCPFADVKLVGTGSV